MQALPFIYCGTLLSYLIFETLVQDFLAVQWLKTSPSNAGGMHSILGHGAKIPHASWPKDKHKTEATL